MAVSQPDFYAAYRAGSQAARNNQVARGDGNDSHAAVSHWKRFFLYGQKISPVRTVDATSPYHERLDELDLAEAYCWWLVTQVGVSVETAWEYLGIANAWHERFFYRSIAGGLPRARIKRMLDGMQNMTGRPIERRVRVGVRPQHLRAGIDALPSVSANMKALEEACFGATARCGELASGFPRGEFRPQSHPTRADLDFEYDARGVPIAATLMLVNSKARGAERFRKLQRRLPMTGRYLSPGDRLYRLVMVDDPVPDHLKHSTPLFRDPATNSILTVSEVRGTLRRQMAAIGRDGSVYGAHSIRIGCATALAFLKAPITAIKAMGVWKSDAFLNYTRSCRTQYMSYLTAACGADVDDFEAECVAIDGDDLDETDYD